MDPKNNEEVEQIRYCKKCGCELASTSKRKLCENCRRKRNAKIREWGAGAVATVVGLFLVVPKLLGNLNDNTSSDVDSSGDDEENSEDEENNLL